MALGWACALKMGGSHPHLPQTMPLSIDESEVTVTAVRAQGADFKASAYQSAEKTRLKPEQLRRKATKLAPSPTERSTGRRA